VIVRGSNFQEIPLNIVGGSSFGRYAKISTEKTINLFESDGALVSYSGYKEAIPASEFFNATEGRGIFSSTKFNRLVVVQGPGVYLVDIQYSQEYDQVTLYSVDRIGTLESVSGVVYIAENNKPQIAISDGSNLYVYDPSKTGSDPKFTKVLLDFTPGYLTFHRAYFILATSNQTWRLSLENEGYDTASWPNSSGFVGGIQTKPDNVQAIVRFPSKGNMILVMGSVVTESWFNTGAQLFPYQRNNQADIDYGCLQPATVASMDEMVVWLGKNESSGPVILASNGGQPQKLSSDGIDYMFSKMQAPQDSRAFLYRQDGHLFYHINFYTDNVSLFYDFRSQRFYNASDQNGNYFIASQVAFYDNQYYFVTKNNGYMFALDTTITTYDDVTPNGVVTRIIPRSRICQNIRDASQEYRIINDIGFTIESGETKYLQQIANGEDTGFGNLSLPRVDLSVSTDGGASFGTTVGQYLRPIGKRKNKLQFWCGFVANDFVAKFEIWSKGRVVIFDGTANVRI